MADNLHYSSPTEQIDNTAESEKTPLRLKFPTITLDTSFESLLSNSTASSSDTIIMSSTTPTPGLDESWTSLDVSDTQSDNGDTGSLIDLSSTQDTESAVEYDTQSDVSLTDDREPVVPGAEEPAGQQDQTGHVSEALQEDEDEEDSLILQPSRVQDDKESISLEHSCRLPNCRHDAAGSRQEAVLTQDTVRMKASRACLATTDRPFNIAYYGSASAAETKNEVLGKIGAVIVASSPSANSQSRTVSPCYSIVPTEFGPGSRPAFSDLVPSHAQMTLEEMTFSKRSRKNPKDVRFAFKRGLVFESYPGHQYNQSTIEPWRPDLLVVHISRDDLADNFFAVNEALELARRHFWPTIIVATDATESLYPVEYPCGITRTIAGRTSTGATAGKRMQPVDLDTFVKLDTAQLSQHLQYITDKANQKRAENMILGKSVPWFQSTTRTWWPTTNERSIKVDEYALHRVELDSFPCDTEQKPSLLVQIVEEARTALYNKQWLRDTLLACVVVALSVYTVAFSQRVYQRMGISLASHNSSESHPSIPQAVTVTATSVLSTATTIFSHAPPTAHEVMVYDPVSFDQVWNRLTGRQVADEPAVDMAVSIAVPETSDKGSNTLVASDNARALLEQLKNSLSRMWMFTQRVIDLNLSQMSTSLTTRLRHGRQARVEKREQIQQMHQKLYDFWIDVSQNVNDLNMQTQSYLIDLVQESQHHLRKARSAGEKQLEQLIWEQKHILARAQNQAHVLASKVPAQKKRSFFGNG